MRLSVSCVYWMLLFTSVVSSALLFLIVASENIQNNKFIGPDKNQVLTQDENITVEKGFQDQLDAEEKPKIKIPSITKPKLKDQNFNDFQPSLSASFEVTKNEESKIPEEIEILKESLTQQPNLSQGISDVGQAVVLTLVDTASTLQSLAAGRADYRPKINNNNNSNIDDAQLQQDSLVNISNLLGKDDNNNNVNDHNETKSRLYNEEEVVVIVRAEQKNSRTNTFTDELGKEKSQDEKEETQKEELEDDITREQQQRQQQQQQQQQIPTTAPELNNSAARARLTGSADDSAAVILDSLVTAGPSEPHEEIPSFNEWAQKRLEEAEKKKTHPNASVQTANGSPGRNVNNMRMRSKNYASPDCGAKIVAANPESRGARNVLVSTRDEYMLNTCTSRIWFVVELCEAIQAKKIELANFELFSSSPKDLSVYVSDRFPTRDWSNVGQFTARDERDVQSFLLQPHLFGKFIKVELHSHYGSEHFCPISLFRAYGTSEFEVLETETETEHVDSQSGEITDGDKVTAGSDVENEEDDDEETLFGDEEESTNDQPSHLFGSARDAVLSIVKKATEVLVKSEDLKSTNNITKIQESIKGDVLEDSVLDECITPMYNIACHDCTDDRFARVFQLISCKGNYLESLLKQDFVLETLSFSHLCGSSSGFDYLFDNDACTDGSEALTAKYLEESNYYLRAKFVTSFLTPDYIIALCNVLAAREQRLFVNSSHQGQGKNDATPNETRTEQLSKVSLPTAGDTKDERITPTKTTESTKSEMNKVQPETPVIKSKLETTTESQIVSENLATQIKPTKTTKLTNESKKNSISHDLETSKSHQTEESNVHKIESSATTPIPSVTKRATTTRSQEQPQAPPASQEKSQQREVPTTGTTTKVLQNTETIQNVNEKSTSAGVETVEINVKTDEETEIKPKVESVEQEQKNVNQDQLNFEGFDFKDLDVDSMQTNGGVKNDGSITQQTGSSATPQQKESVFLRLSNRIKTLERNMSLSSQYLEELSRRYKKQVEEMQRSLERAMAVMNEESRKSEERESKRSEEVTTLRNQIETLNRILDDLIYERNSWTINFATMMQHSVFVFIDVVVVILILSYCCKNRSDDDFYEERERNVRKVVLKPRNAKRTYEIVKQTCSQLTKKTKKRRPSEIAAQVSGTYDQLMIKDANQVTKKDRRKKRRGILRSLSTKESLALDTDKKSHNRSASASDALYSTNGKDNLASLSTQKQNRPESAPDETFTYFPENENQLQTDKKVQILAMDISNDEVMKNDDHLDDSLKMLDTSFSLDDDAFEPVESSPSSFSSKVKKFSSPSFMRTALGSRSKRISFSNNRKQSQSFDESTITTLDKKYNPQMGSLTEWNTSLDDRNNGLSSANGIADESDESRASSATPTGNKKEKKTNGLKKMKRLGTT